MTFRAALRAVAGVPGLSLMGSMVGFGAFAHGAGWSLFETFLSTLLIWALPAQVILIGAVSTGTGLFAALAAVSVSSIRLLPMVCSLLPLVRNERTRLWQLVVASHFVAQTIWILGFLHLHEIPRENRLRFFFQCSALLVSGALTCGSVGWLVAAELPFPLAVALIMLTPASFLLLTAKAARRTEERIAIVLGLCLLPIIHEVAPIFGLGDWDLLLTGLIGGTLAFGVGLFVDARRAA